MMVLRVEPGLADKPVCCRPCHPVAPPGGEWPCFCWGAPPWSVLRRRQGGHEHGHSSQRQVDKRSLSGGWGMGLGGLGDWGWEGTGSRACMGVEPQVNTPRPIGFLAKLTRPQARGPLLC